MENAVGREGYVRGCGRVCPRAPHGTIGVFTATWACFPVVTF